MTDEFSNKEYRDAFVDALIRNGLAFQIRALRKRQEWSQAELGCLVETAQNVISRYEDPDYGNFSLNTLKRLAATFNVGLVCHFATFGDVRRVADSVSQSTIAVPTYDMEIHSAALGDDEGTQAIDAAELADLAIDAPAIADDATDAVGLVADTPGISNVTFLQRSRMDPKTAPDTSADEVIRLTSVGT